MAIRIPSLSVEYVRVAVSATEFGLPIDPTGDVVELAFTAPRVEPQATDWTVGSWEEAAGVYYARCLVGPGGDVTLTDGLYDAWVRVTDDPEVPVRRVGQVIVT